MLKRPTNSKYKYQFSPKFPGKGLKGFGISNTASFIIISLNSGLLSPQHLEASRRILSKPIREEGGSLKICFFPHIPLSKKPLQTRMGKGKGRPEKWVARIQKGCPLFEITGNNIPLDIIQLLFHRVSHRLPVEIKLIKLNLFLCIITFLIFISQLPYKPTFVFSQTQLILIIKCNINLNFNVKTITKMPLTKRYFSSRLHFNFQKINALKENIKINKLNNNNNNMYTKNRNLEQQYKNIISLVQKSNGHPLGGLNHNKLFY